MTDDSHALRAQLAGNRILLEEMITTSDYWVAKTAPRSTDRGMSIFWLIWSLVNLALLLMASLHRPPEWWPVAVNLASLGICGLGFWLAENTYRRRPGEHDTWVAHAARARVELAKISPDSFLMRRTDE